MAEVVDADVLDHADDAEPRAVGVVTRADLLAYGVLTGEQQLGRGLADDHVGDPLLLLDPLEEPALQELDPHRLEVGSAGGGVAEPGRLCAARLDLPARHGHGARALVQGQRGDEADGLDAG